MLHRALHIYGPTFDPPHLQAFVFLTSRATDVSHLLVQGADAGLFTGLTSMFFNQVRQPTHTTHTNHCTRTLCQFLVDHILLFAFFRIQFCFFFFFTSCAPVHCIALQLLHSKELHAAVVTKHGPTIMRGAVMLNPLTHLWMQVRPLSPWPLPHPPSGRSLTHLWMQVQINTCHSRALPLGMSLSAPYSGRA